MNIHTVANRETSIAATADLASRQLEIEVIQTVTDRIRSAAEAGRFAHPQLVEALSENQRIWTAFALSVADGANVLPQDLRAGIFYLAEFVQLHTGRVLAGKAHVAPLLDTNMAILNGLGAQSALQ